MNKIHTIVLAFIYLTTLVLPVCIFVIGGGLLVAGDLEVDLDKNQIFGLLVLLMSINYVQTIMRMIQEIRESYLKQETKKETEP